MIQKWQNTQRTVIILDELDPHNLTYIVKLLSENISHHNRSFWNAVFYFYCTVKTHRRNHAAGANAVVKSSPVLEIRVFTLGQHVLVSRVVGLLVGHPASTFYSDGVTARKVGLHVSAVSSALILTALELFVFKESNLLDGCREK